MHHPLKQVTPSSSTKVDWAVYSPSTLKPKTPFSGNYTLLSTFLAVETPTSPLKTRLRYFVIHTLRYFSCGYGERGLGYKDSMSPPSDSPLPFPDWGILFRGIRIDRFNVKPLSIPASWIRTRFGHALIPNHFSGFGFPFFPDACYRLQAMKPIQALLALFTCAFLPLNAASLADLTWTTTNGQVTITDCNEAAGENFWIPGAGELVIPDTIEGNPVTSIGESAFLDCSGLTSITIPDRVSSIGGAAFESCTSLTSITIPDRVTSIGESAFLDCTSLTSITIPDRVTSVEKGTFRGCTSLTSITIPDRVSSIGGAAFYDCTSLTSITIPDGVTSIGDEAFYRCTSLTSITIPDSVTSIGGAAFSNCTSLTSITIPDGVTSIGNNAFLDCTGLTSITIPDGVTSIGDYAFQRCTSLASITFQGGAPTVGSEAFLGVADGAIALVTIENQASFGASGNDWNGLTLKTITPLTWTTTGGEVTITDCNEGATGELVIPDTIEGNPITSIGGAAFESCTSLTSITIPDSVTSIGDEAFFRCTSLTSITIPDRVTSIGDFAFENCTSLTSITIGNGVTSIGGSAFYGCTSLTSITIGNGVISIGGSAFRNCTSLTSITFLGTAPTVGTNAFTGVADGAIALVTIEDLNSFGENDEKWNGLTLTSTEAPPQSLEVQLAQMTAERDAAIAERDARPTQESFDAVKAERDDRPSLSEVKDARLGSVVLQSDGANDTVKISFSIEETDDLKTWTSNGEVNEIIVPLEAGKRFYRFALEDK